jgi:hypothetical protein
MAGADDDDEDEDEAVAVAAVELREVDGAGAAIEPAVMGTRDENAGGAGELNGATTGETGARRANGESAGAAGEAVAAAVGVTNEGNSWYCVVVL